MKIEALEKFRDYNNEIVVEDFKKLNKGQKDVVQSYIYYQNNDESKLIDLLVFDHIWASHLQEMIDYLKELNIKKFIFADTSTDCFESIKILINNGCQLSTINYKIEKCFSMPDKIESGILVEI